MLKTYTAEVVEILDNGDAILQLPEDLCTELDWRVGDTLNLSDEPGKIIIKNVNSDNRKNQLENL